MFSPLSVPHVISPLPYLFNFMTFFSSLLKTNKQKAKKHKTPT